MIEGKRQRKEREEKRIRELDGRDQERKERESKEIDVLIVGAIMWLAYNLATGKFLPIHKDDPG